MLAIITYAFGIMYTPGPVNLLSMHSGINGKLNNNIGFFIGVTLAMFTSFVTFGFLGSQFINPLFYFGISVIGCCYIAYVAWSVLRTVVNVNPSLTHHSALSIKDGFFLQLFNPKGLLSTLPIATVNFPAEHIHGVDIIIWSLGLSLLAFGAPVSYYLIGSLVGKTFSNPLYFKVFNVLMAMLLFLVAINIGYEYIYLQVKHSKICVFISWCFLCE